MQKYGWGTINSPSGENIAIQALCEYLDKYKKVSGQPTQASFHMWKTHFRDCFVIVNELLNLKIELFN